MPIRKDQQHPQAELTFDEIIKAWFVHAGRAYPVESAPAAIFNAAVPELVPNWSMSPIYWEALASQGPVQCPVSLRYCC